MKKYLDKTFFKHIGFSFALPGIRFFYGFLLASMMSQHLSIQDYGIWSLFISMIGLVLTFSSLSLMYSSQVIFPTKKRSELDKELTHIALFKISITIFIGLLFLVYMMYQNLFETFIIQLFVLFLLFRTIADLVFGLLRALLKVKEQVFFLFFESFLIIFFLFINIQFISSSTESAITSFLIAEVIASLYGYYLLKGHLNFTKFDFSLIKPYLAIGIPLIPFAFMDLIINAMTPLFIKLYSSLDQVAFYSIAQKVAMIITIPSSILNNIYTQYLSKSYQKSKTEMLNTLKKFFFLYFVSILMMAIILFYFGKNIIVFISSERYLDSFNMMLLLLLANIFVIFSSIFTSIFAVMKKTKLISVIWIGVLFIYIVLSIVLSQYYQVQGAIYAILISFGIGFTSIVFLTIKELGRDYE